jgi:hypothetical protein
MASFDARVHRYPTFPHSVSHARTLRHWPERGQPFDITKSQLLSGGPLVANITNATLFTYPLLLAFLFLLPQAGVLARRYGRIAGASEDHQKDYSREADRPKAHQISYNILPHGTSKSPARAL